MAFTPAELTHPGSTSLRGRCFRGVLAMVTAGDVQRPGPARAAG
jgi:hypothetical protein